MSNQTRRTLRSRTSSTSSPAATSPPPSSMATQSSAPRGRTRDPTAKPPKGGHASPPSVGENTSPTPEAKTISGSRFAPLQEEATAPSPAKEGVAPTEPDTQTPGILAEGSSPTIEDTTKGAPDSDPSGGKPQQDTKPDIQPRPSAPSPSPPANNAVEEKAPSPSLPDNPAYSADSAKAWDGLLSTMGTDPAPAPHSKPSRDDVMRAASIGDIDLLLRLVERFAAGGDAQAQSGQLSTQDTHSDPYPPSDRGTKRAATPSGATPSEGSPKRTRPGTPPGDDIADLYDDLEGPSANTDNGRQSFARIMRAVHDRDPEAVPQQLGNNMQALHYGLDVLEREEVRLDIGQTAPQVSTPATPHPSQALGGGNSAATMAPPAPAATPSLTTASAPQAHTGIRIVTAGSTPGPHPFPAGVTIRTLTRGVSTACVARWLKHRGIPFFGSQMNPHNGPENTNAAAKAIRAHFPDLEFAIWTASYVSDGVQPPQNVAAYFLRTDNEEAIERLAEAVHIIRPHINLTFIPIDRGLHPGETWYTNIDGLGLPIMDSWIKQDLRESIQEILLEDDTFRALVTATRDNVPEEIASEDVPEYIVRTLRVVPLSMALPGGTSFNYAIRIFGLPPTLDVSAFQQLQAHLYSMTFTTPYGIGYAHLFDVCGVCTAMDHPRGLCSLPSIPGYLGPLPGRELNPAAVASEALVDPSLAIGHAHLIGIRTVAADDNQPAAPTTGPQTNPPMGGQTQNGTRGARGGRGGFSRGRGGARGAARGRGRGRGGSFIF